MNSLFYSFFLFLISSTIFAQKPEYSITLIPDSLKQNANAVIRLEQKDIFVSSGVSFYIKKKLIVTVFNDKGLSTIAACENYDKRTTVESIRATVLDSTGNEIKKFKRKDFTDQNINRDRRPHSDDRFIYLNYTTAFKYPYTVIYESALETNTNIVAHIPQWIPFLKCMVSIEKSFLNVSYPNNIGFKKMEFNFPNAKISKTVESSTKLSYKATNIPAVNCEIFDRNFSETFPKVVMLLLYF